MARAYNVAAVILAAGQSSRMGCNKLVLEIDGKPMLRHVADAAVGSLARPVVAVLGGGSAGAFPALEGLDVVVVRNMDFCSGMSSSIRAGIAALPETSDAALILLGDMPAISSFLIDRMTTAFDPAKGRDICVATHKGQHGHPVLFARHYFPELLTLEGDVGARRIVEKHAAFVCAVEAGDDGPLVDIDTPAALAAFQAQQR